MESDQHQHGRFSHPDEYSMQNDEPLHDGTREIKLQLLIGEVQKEVTFPFNVETDTAQDVAAEMATEFSLNCDVDWLTNELQRRVNSIESTAHKHQASPPSTNGVTPPGTATKSRHPDRFGDAIHDSPRMSAVTVPIDQKHLNKQTEQTSEGSWLVPAISMPQPAMDPSNGDPAAAGEIMETVHAKPGTAEHMPPVVPGNSEPVVSEHPGSFNEQQERGVLNASENGDVELPAKTPEQKRTPEQPAAHDNSNSEERDNDSQHQPEAAEDNIMSELDELDEQIEETNAKIAELNTKVAQLNQLRTRKFMDLKSLRNRKGSQPRPHAPTVPVIDGEPAAAAVVDTVPHARPPPPLGPPPAYAEPPTAAVLDGEAANVSQASTSVAAVDGEAGPESAEGLPNWVDMSSQPTQRGSLDNSSIEMPDGAVTDGQPPAKSQQVDDAMAKQLGAFQLKPRAAKPTEIKPTEKEEEPLFR
jgi:TolA-binding protein